MGCLFSRKSHEEQSEPVKKEYSWDKRKHIRVEDFLLDGFQDRTVVRLPGSIAGQQFIVQNCSNCKIFLLDHTATITVEKCTDCQIVTGPIKGSIFLRNCKNCKCLCACQQFRTRDCSKTDVFLFCMTQPIIENSFKMKFGCYQLFYDGLQQQFKDAGLEILNNNWNTIYDFTPNPDEGPNWALMPEDATIYDFFTLETERHEDSDGDASREVDLNKHFLPDNLHLSSNPSVSVIPMTTGKRGKTFDESCLVLIFHHDEASKSSIKIIRELQKSSVNLIRSKELFLSEEKAAEMFDKSSESDFLKAAKCGAVIGLEFNGENCTEKCNDAIKAVPDGVRRYASSSKQLIDQFYSTDDMQMM